MNLLRSAKIENSCFNRIENYSLISTIRINFTKINIKKFFNLKSWIKSDFCCKCSSFHLNIVYINY